MKTMCPPGYHHNGFVATHAHHVPKCMSCHKAIVVITGRAHCFHDYIYIYYAHLASVRFEHSVCRGSLMTTYTYIHIYYIIHCKIKRDNHQVPKIVRVPGNKTNPKKIRIKICK